MGRRLRFHLEMHMSEVPPTRPASADQLRRLTFWQAALNWLAEAAEKKLEVVADVVTADHTGEDRPIFSVLRDATSREAQVQQP